MKKTTAINIETKDYYEFRKPELRERTKTRLKQLIKLGLTEVGVAQFGVVGVVSGLYIEKVWGFNKDEWDSYIQFVIETIRKKKRSITKQDKIRNLLSSLKLNESKEIREFIAENWHSNDFFSRRSFDVFFCNIRKEYLNKEFKVKKGYVVRIE